MPLQKGHSPEVVSSNIREMIASGYSRKQAVAAALSSARKSKKMAEGGLVDKYVDDNPSHSPEHEMQESAEMEKSEQEKQLLADALHKKGEEHSENVELKVEHPEMPIDNIDKSESDSLEEKIRSAIEAKRKNRRF